jgi:hypothetical protein
MWLKILLLMLLCVSVNAEERNSSFYVAASNIKEYNVGMMRNIKSDEQITISTKENESICVVLPNKIVIKV